MPHVRGDDGPLTWFLLIHRAATEVRCELSLPSQISPDGRITRWQERIMLPSIPLDGAEIAIVPPAGPDFDLDVTRQARVPLMFLTRHTLRGTHTGGG